MTLRDGLEIVWGLLVFLSLLAMEVRLERIITLLEAAEKRAKGR